VDWGSFPDWLAGIGAIVALLFAFFAVRAAHQTNVQQGKQLQALEHQQTQEQASKVAVWLDWTGDDVPAYHISNTSGLPIYEVYLNAARSMVSLFHATYEKVIPPGDTFIALTPIGEYDGQHIPANATAAMAFTDCSMNTWVRDPDGLLVQADPLESPADYLGEATFKMAQQEMKERNKKQVPEVAEDVATSD
jgi:hypothetical protein